MSPTMILGGPLTGSSRLHSVTALGPAWRAEISVAASLGRYAGRLILTRLVDISQTDGQPGTSERRTALWAVSEQHLKAGLLGRKAQAGFIGCVCQNGGPCRGGDPARLLVFLVQKKLVRGLTLGSLKQ